MTPVTKDTVKEEKAVNTEEEPIETEVKPEGKKEWPCKQISTGFED